MIETSFDRVTSKPEVMDSRDLIEARKEAESELEMMPEPIDEQDPEVEELKALIEGVDDLDNSGITDWQYGATLIRDDYFVQYAQEFAEDIGRMENDNGWPYTHIDWQAAADDLRQDYTSVTFLEEEYWVRS